MRSRSRAVAIGVAGARLVASACPLQRAGVRGVSSPSSAAGPLSSSSTPRYASRPAPSIAAAFLKPLVKAPLRASASVIAVCPPSPYASAKTTNVPSFHSPSSSRTSHSASNTGRPFALVALLTVVVRWVRNPPMPRTSLIRSTTYWYLMPLVS
jgi:hypothetical protein